MDRAVVSFAERRQFARVIEMRMAQDDGVNDFWVERKIFVQQFRFLAMALEQAAFEQQIFAVDLDEIHRAGGCARRAEEVDFHLRQLSQRLNADGTRIFRAKTDWTSAAVPLDFANRYEM
jgi:hypothetical protein